MMKMKEMPNMMPMKSASSMPKLVFGRKKKKTSTEAMEGKEPMKSAEAADSDDTKSVKMAFKKRMK